MMMSGDIAPLRVFQLRAEARAWLWKAAVFTDAEQAFAPLFDDAIKNGLHAEFGVEVLSAIVWEACQSARVFENEGAAQ